MSNSRVRSPKRFGFIFLVPILLLGFFVSYAKAGEANHLVISAVQITEGEGKTNHDFVEIYNPTSSDINLKGYRLVKRTKIGTSDTSIKSWTDDAIVKAHGWRLWVSSDNEAFSASLGADDFTKQTISADNGIAIRSGAADTGEIIDSIAWGAAENIFKEGNIPANPAVSESLVRKPGNGNGNGEDTNNNANDFNIISSFTPHNSSSFAQPAVSAGSENNPGTSTSSDSSENISSLSPSSASVIQSSAPTAETGDDKTAVIGEVLNFDGSDSFDINDREITYIWDFGDGKTAKGENVRHAYSAIGEFTVVLKVNNGTAIGEDSLKVKVSEPEFSDKIVLSEILPDPKGADTEGEWIELANQGDKEINLGGWILDDVISAGSKPCIFGSGNSIESKGFLVIKRSESKLVLANTGGEINLLWYDGKPISKVSYEKAKEGESYALLGGRWQWTNNLTPGKENIIVRETASVGSKKTISENSILVENKITKPSEENVSSVKSANSDDINEDVEATVVSGEILSASVSDAEAKDSKKISSSASIQKDPQDTADSTLPEESKKESDKEQIGNDLDSADYNSEEDRIPTKSNPWFWGDMGLSVMSLFLVWRYQSLKKKIR